MPRVFQCGQILRPRMGRAGSHRAALPGALITLCVAMILAMASLARAATSEVVSVGAIHDTYVDSAIFQHQDAYSTTLETINGNQVVSRATFSVPFADPQVQRAVSEAASILTADGAFSVSAPTLLSNVVTNSSDLSYFITGHSATASQTTGLPITTVGPATIEVDLNVASALTDFGYVISPEPLFVPAGDELFTRPSTFDWTVYRNAVTTSTSLTSQTYVITGAGSVASAQTVLSASLPPAAWSGIATLCGIGLIALARGVASAAGWPEACPVHGLRR
jgi:hypothetical protein